jgi:ribonuclease P/MRP protein subunit POP5
MVWAALTFMTRLPKPIDIPVVIRVVRVSGTIRKAEEEIIRRAKELVLRARTAEEITGEAAIVRDVVRAVEKSRETEVVVMDEEEDESDSD